MVKNNVEVDVKIKLLEANLTQVQLGEKIGTTGQYINRVMKNKDMIVNKTFVQMMDALGYDIQITYLPKEEV